MRFSSTALTAAAIAFAITVNVSAQQTSADHAALVQRLVQSLPPSGGRVEDGVPSIRSGAATVERSLVAANPGREAQIASLLDHYALCVATGIYNAAPSLFAAAASANLSDDELRALTDYYSGHDHTRFDDIVERLRRNETVSPEDQAFFQRTIENPATVRLQRAVQQLAGGYLQSQEGQRMTADCVATLRQSIAAAGLKAPPT